MSEPAFEVTNINAHYGANHVLHDVSVTIPRQSITALIGASGCGKTTFLRCLNRMNDLVPSFRLTGTIEHERESLYGRAVDPIAVRRRIGMVFQKPNPFPKSIYDNVAYGLRIQGVRDKRRLDETVRDSLQHAALWSEVADRLRSPALRLSGGQQQRLCIARTIAVSPDVILFDEPCSALDPIATKRIEELMMRLKEDYSMVVVTHNLQQARRIADYVGFIHLGKMVEFGPADSFFEQPQQKLTRDYLRGEFG